MKDLFQIITLKRRRVNFLLIGGKTVAAFGGPKPTGAVTVERLDAVVDRVEGLSADRKTLRVGALGIVLVADHLASMKRYAKSGRLLRARLSQLFAGSAYFSEMLRATLRAVFNRPAVGGDTGIYFAAATRQLESWSTDTVDVEVCRPR